MAVTDSCKKSYIPAIERESGWATKVVSDGRLNELGVGCSMTRIYI